MFKQFLLNIALTYAVSLIASDYFTEYVTSDEVQEKEREALEFMMDVAFNVAFATILSVLQTDKVKGVSSDILTEMQKVTSSSIECISKILRCILSSLSCVKEEKREEESSEIGGDIDADVVGRTDHSPSTPVVQNAANQKFRGIWEL